MKKILLSLFLVFLFAGCFGKKVDVKSKVEGNTYVLESVLENSEINISFENEKLAGLAGVNRYFSEYSIEGNKIVVKEIGMTRMMGPENLMLQEQEYLKNLNEAKEIVTTEKGVLITTKSGVKLNFVKK